MYICSKDKGCILVGRKKYRKGDELPGNFKPSKAMLDNGMVKAIPEPKAPVVEEPKAPVVEEPKKSKKSKKGK